MFIEFRTVKNAWSAKVKFYTVLLQIYSGNCSQTNGILDLNLIKLLQNEQGCKFFASQCICRNSHKSIQKKFQAGLVHW